MLDSLSGNTFLNNEPQCKQYHLLKSYLKKYKAIKLKNNLPIISTDKKRFKLNDSSKTIVQLKQWFYLMGDLKENNQSIFFDEPLQAAVKNAQQRFGIKTDGIIASSLINEMNYPLEKRIETIMVKMERCRWVPVKLEDEYLLVNIPEYKLHVVQNDSLVFSMKVVVGKNQHKTVIFNGTLKYVVFSPYWNIPSSIINNEILPAMRRNRNYLSKHNMEWNNGRIRQRPGPNNSLGLVKFLFPNSHSIYLHNTPSKSLFGEDNRNFSHGCIRLEEPKKLAVYLLRNDPKWNDSTIDAAMNRGTQKMISLQQPLPVFIAYFTSWVAFAGRINFRKDVYKRDERLVKMILDKPSI